MKNAGAVGELLLITRDEESARDGRELEVGWKVMWKSMTMMILAVWDVEAAKGGMSGWSWTDARQLQQSRSMMTSKLGRKIQGTKPESCLRWTRRRRFPEGPGPTYPRGMLAWTNRGNTLSRPVTRERMRLARTTALEWALKEPSYRALGAVKEWVALDHVWKVSKPR